MLEAIAELESSLKKDCHNRPTRECLDGFCHIECKFIEAVLLLRLVVHMHLTQVLYMPLVSFQCSSSSRNLQIGITLTILSETQTCSIVSLVSRKQDSGSSSGTASSKLLSSLSFEAE